MGPRPDDTAWRDGAAEVWLPTAEEMAEVDRRATSSGATTERTLIEAAGREVARQLHLRYPEGRVVGLLGSGHNGADALVALRSLQAWGREVTGLICGSGPPEPDVAGGWEIHLEEAEERLGELSGAAVILDGILGTGVSGAPRERQARIIERANASGVPIVAVDGPSGADLTTGGVPGACVRARMTVALGWPTLGLLFPPARARCGEVVAVEIGFPPPDPVPAARAITARWVRRFLTPRPPDAHKGRAGYLAVVAGQAGMAGASVLAARAGARAGAGIVRVVGDPANRVVVQTAVPDAVFTSWDDGGAVREAVEWSHALAVGPGLGRDRERRALVEAVLGARGERPVLLDADGINAWADEVDVLSDALGGAPALLTPHPGELARLLGADVGEVLDDRPARAREVARRTGATVLLKGAPSVVAPPDGPLRVSTVGGAEVASGGSGDVLTGLAGALLAAGLGPADAAAAALLLSGVAAGRSAAPEGHLASDVPDRLPAVRAELASLSPHPAGPVLFRLPAVHSGP